MDLPIGTEIVHKGTTYLVEESASCYPCAFFDSERDECRKPIELFGHCAPLLRKDGRAISYLKV